MAENNSADAAADAAIAEAVAHARASMRVHDMNALQASVFGIGLARYGERLVQLAQRAIEGGEINLDGEPTMVIAALGFAMFEAGVKLDNQLMRVNGARIIERCFEAFNQRVGGE